MPIFLEPIHRKLSVSIKSVVNVKSLMVLNVLEDVNSHLLNLEPLLKLEFPWIQVIDEHTLISHEIFTAQRQVAHKEELIALLKTQLRKIETIYFEVFRGLQLSLELKSESIRAKLLKRKG